MSGPGYKGCEAQEDRVLPITHLPVVTAPRDRLLPLFWKLCQRLFFFNPLTDEGTSIGLKSGSEENRESRYGNQAGLEMN